MISGIALLLAGAGAAGFHHARRRQSGYDLPLAPVRKGEFLVTVRSRGELKASRSAQVVAPNNVPDLRIVWQAPPNSQVKEGEPVIRFDPSSARNQLAEKEAALKQAQASLDQAEAQARITAEADQRDLSGARYQVERARLEVSKQEIVSALKAEESRIDLELAIQKLSVQEATVAFNEASSKAKIASLARVRDQAKSDVELNQYRLTQMELKAPISGVIVYLPNYSQGWNNAKPFKVGDQVWAGAAVAEVPDLGSLELEGKIEEIDRGRVSPGADARIRIDSLPEASFPARLERISPLTQMSWEWPPTSSFRGYASTLKPDERLRPGMNGSLDIVYQRIPNALSIPAKALFTSQGRPVVYLARGGAYDAVPVKVTARNPDEVAIEGIAADSQVALVEPGAEVKGKGGGK